MYIDKRFFANFMAKYEELDERFDRTEDRLDKAQAEGNEKKAEKLDRRLADIVNKMDGMTDVLMMLGYEVRYQNGKPVIVERGM